MVPWTHKSQLQNVLTIISSAVFAQLNRVRVPNTQITPVTYVAIGRIYTLHACDAT